MHGIIMDFGFWLLFLAFLSPQATAFKCVEHLTEQSSHTYHSSSRTFGGMKATVAHALFAGAYAFTPCDAFVPRASLPSISSKARHCELRVDQGGACDGTASLTGARARPTVVMGLRNATKKAWRRVRGDKQGAERSDAELKEGIATFYDKSTNIWEDMWGEHMHHGYYVQGNKPKSMDDHRAAQRFMVGRSLEWAGVQEGGGAPKTGVDVGCGVGGSSRQISRRYGTSMTGITLSPVQRDRAQAISEAAGLGEKCKFQVADALDTPFETDSFDLVWSMESGEHMPYKPKFVGELARICAPGGRILVITWCHRDLEEGETSLQPDEEKLLNKINKAYYLPRWCSTADYVKYFEAEGLVDIKRDDWTDNIQSFWPAVIRSSLTPKGIFGLIKSGPVTIRGAVAMFLMVRGYKKNLVKFALITGKKP